MRKLFIIIAFILLVLIGVLGIIDHRAFWAYAVVLPLIALGIYNMVQPRHTILRNFPVLGYARYMFEFIAPEIQQYFIERHTDGRPFSRQQRSLVYQRAKNVGDTVPFGTQLDINAANYEGIRHSIYPKEVPADPPRVKIGGEFCTKPYMASLLNISAMSFGALSDRAVLALNTGARKGGFYHNTGEGGLSEHHLKPGGDLVWQIGTGYFGCRTKDGDFDPELFRSKVAEHHQVRMIELKLSQGAKPGHGGVLPAVKNSEEIARIRHIVPHTTVLSPPGHSAFTDGEGLLRFIGQLRELSGGLPVGFKLCIGRTEEFTELCEKMVGTGMRPDFITVDGAEGGTGASPLEFTDSVGMPIEPALMFVRRTLERFGLHGEIKIIASGKVLTAASLMKMLALGADLCNSARGFMFSLGCIQALRCNTNDCPTGITTQDPALVRGIVVSEKCERVFNFHRNTLLSLMELLAACGLDNVDDVNMSHFMRGDEFVKLADRYFPDGLNKVMYASPGGGR
ncbi:MAG: FMN-binding glutamate synthase family protein [Flavobacteriales bacterium]|jgi:glutamate synthase domain-containing protein 2|nr:FMN-binding glutamate synthase family protein [Flavobacteriales bacterium]MCB0758590.1 FMN-binding glutamate synthase family protein [Flavobacteriales bacterium]